MKNILKRNDRSSQDITQDVTQDVTQDTTKADDEFIRFQKEFGKRLKTLRNKKGVTQEWMDDKKEFGIDIKHYQNIEQGRANITLKTMYKICKKLDIHPGELLKEISF